MLFNSYDFVFYFFPIMLAIFYLSYKFKNPLVTNWIFIIGSLSFYGWESDHDIPLIVASIGLNFLFAQQFRHIVKPKVKKRLLTLAICLNLLVLVYFKYFHFIIIQLGQLKGSEIIALNSKLLPDHLPLAISFFTFQQIAFLVYCYRSSSSRFSFQTYATSVVFFPHLIAGPLVEYKSLIPQFLTSRSSRALRNNIFLGLFVFTIGLSKKLLVADTLGSLVLELFDKNPQAIAMNTFLQTFRGVLAYTFQLYFDFSGYSDMAIGLALFFGIKLPQNFNSPYKSKSLIEFWRNWHISLSHFLRNYLYIPLGGSRASKLRTYLNLFITMVLGGIWHGAGWNFLIWGAWHGLGLCCNHIFKKFIRISPALSCLTTFLFVGAGWIFFRSSDLDQATAILKNLFRSFSEFDFISIATFRDNLLQNLTDIFILFISALLIWGCPNSETLKIFLRKHILFFNKNSDTKSLALLVFVALIFSFLFALCIVRMSVPQTFIYYQF